MERKDYIRFVPVQTPDGIRWADRANPLMKPTPNPYVNLWVDHFIETRAGSGFVAVALCLLVIAGVGVSGGLAYFFGYVFINYLHTGQL